VIGPVDFSHTVSIVTAGSTFLACECEGVEPFCFNKKQKKYLRLKFEFFTIVQTGKSFG